MKKSKVVSALLAVFCCLNSGLAAKDTVPQKVNVTMPFSKGINLTGWLEDYGSGNYSSIYIGKQDFEDIKSLGVEIIRIPIFFEEFSSGKPDYKIEEWLFKCIDNAVEWCTELKMYMIIDFHNDCDGKSKTKPDVEDMLLKIWPQIAERYKDSSEYVLYEVMNEPHLKSGNISADVSKWNKIQGNVLKKIRSIDKKHTVIVGAEDWNSVTNLLNLVDYDDDNIIYNFHDYSPFLFSHQGATWTDISQIKNIPFPYVKEKMPKLPKKPTDAEKWLYQQYPMDSKESTLVKPLDDAVAFANKRNVALMCNEYGVLMTYAENTERTNWYRLKAKWMEERNIIHISWDYKNSFGIFKRTEEDPRNLRFPEDLNTELVEGMGFKVPAGKSRARYTWFENAKKTDDYTIYENGFAEGIVFGPVWLSNLRVNMLDSADDDSYINFKKMDPWYQISFGFGEACDLSDLVEADDVLEFEVRVQQNNLKLSVYFMDEESDGDDLEGKAWRCIKELSSENLPADDNWHKITIPLKSFWDTGAWSNKEQKWYNAQNLFSWKKVDRLIFDFGEKGASKDVAFRNIKIKKADH